MRVDDLPGSALFHQYLRHREPVQGRWCRTRKLVQKLGAWYGVKKPVKTCYCGGPVNSDDGIEGRYDDLAPWISFLSSVLGRLLRFHVCSLIGLPYASVDEDPILGHHFHLSHDVARALEAAILVNESQDVVFVIRERHTPK